MTFPPTALVDAPLLARASRRAFLERWSAASLAVIGISPGWPLIAITAPVVTLASPVLLPLECAVTIAIRITVTIRVTISHLTPGAAYEVRGVILESDAPDGAPDTCGPLVSQVISSAHRGPQTLLLKGRLRAVDLGLLKGHGPARDESFSPDLVELVARVWLQNLRTGAQEGPWTSPPRIAIARHIDTWRPTGQRPGRELAIPRTGGPSVGSSGAVQITAPQWCAP